MRWCLACGGLLLAAALAPAMDNADVIKMVKAGLSEETILLAIKVADPADFDTSVEALIELKDAEVNESIIQAMLQRAKGAPVAVGDAGSTPGARPGSNFLQVPDDQVLPPEVDPVPGKEYFVRYTFKFEKGERNATNYWRGELVPINTKVNLIGMRDDKLTFRIVSSGRSVVVENVPKHTNRSIEQIARELLAEEPTAIEKYGEDMARYIRTGTLRLGMTKTQVLLTRGYPPAHETPSLETDLWKYWSSRFVVHSLAFDQGVLVQARGVN